MTNRFASVFFLLLLTGCWPAEEPASAPVTITPTSPPATAVPPVVTAPSKRYMAGYWDGYHGGWLAPFRWTFTDDYRNGWEQGHADRKNGVERYKQDK